MNRLRVFVFPAALLLIAGCAAPDAVRPVGEQFDARRGQVLVFVQPGLSPLQDRFIAEDLPRIGEVAFEQRLPLLLVDARRAAPEEVGITPLIVYQNHLGRSIYQGRYTTLDRVRNFLQTSRLHAQGDAALTRDATPVWDLGRAKIGAPLKIAAVTGTPPASYDHAAFVAEARRAILRGLRHFKLNEAPAFDRSDRLFYMDFYPWRSEDGTLYLSTRLYSQFHCHEPVFTHADPPYVGPWAQRDKLYRQAARDLEAAIEEQMRSSPRGDGFDVVSRWTPRCSWEALGLALRAAPENASSAVAGQPLVQRWRMAAADPTDPPRLRFRYAPPLDHYTGALPEVAGEFVLGDGLRVQQASGWFEADVKTISMGDPDLDEALQSSVFLETATYPTARFTITGVESDAPPLDYGQFPQLVLHGTFRLKEVEIPLAAAGSLEPLATADGAPRLLLRVAFQLDIRDFKLEGPDGPDPQKWTMLFDTHFVLEPAEAVAATGVAAGLGDGAGRATIAQQ